MITTVFLKSTVRPWPSVSRPSSSSCSRMLKTSGCAFSISSSSRTPYGLAADRLGQLRRPRRSRRIRAARRPAGDRCAAPGTRSCRTGSSGPRRRTAPPPALAPARSCRRRSGRGTGRCRSAGSGRPGPARERRTASATAATASSWPMTRSCRCSSSCSSRSLLLLGELRRPGCRCARETTSATSAAVDLRAPAPACARSVASPSGAGSARRSGRAARWRGRSPRRPPPRPSRGCSRSSRCSASRVSGAGVSVRSRTRAPAWSIRSIALSGRNRSVT